MRRASSTERIALSATATTAGGMRLATRSPTDRSSPKSPRSRALTPTTRGPIASARSSSASSWASTTIVEPEIGAGVVQLAEQAVVRQRGDDEQGGVGTRRPGLDELHRIDREVLAEDGQVDRGARRAQVVEVATEVGPIGEHRQAGGPAGGVRGGGVGGDEVGGELALRR